MVKTQMLKRAGDTEDSGSHSEVCQVLKREPQKGGSPEAQTTQEGPATAAGKQDLISSDGETKKISSLDSRARKPQGVIAALELLEWQG